MIRNRMIAFAVTSASKRMIMNERRVFIFEPYIPNGGTFMAYHLGKILHEDFGFFGFAVGDGTAENGIFDYDPVFPCISAEEMEKVITNDDILIANPSFSAFGFGTKLRGLKVMYIQGFNTFSLLDCRFDYYVSVSKFVRNFIANTYGIDTGVVPPFISVDNFPVGPSWQDRPPASILVSLKGQPPHLFARLRELLALEMPHVALDVLDGKVPQHELLTRIGQYRYFLTMAAAEGFGLMPLEAMGMGTTVLGFDGFGGRDYLRSGINCAVVAYPDIEGMADQIKTVLSNPSYGEILAKAGQTTAGSVVYTYEYFRAAWREQFSLALSLVPRQKRQRAA
jgi:hypothetical protein